VIIAELELENYKQFLGTHKFAPLNTGAESGVVGIIGPNGVGKTTLFEAIEWCLYNPRDISNDEIPPRGKAGWPRVKLTLEDPLDGSRFVIQRELKRSSINAEIWREDQPETRIVHGSRQVSEYVSKTLIGLDHTAFVSTFFTRQKELAFFAGSKTERRREVSRLLGFETIRAAQQTIADERKSAESEATGYAKQYQEQSRDRDFAAEIVSKDEIIAASAQAASEAAERLTVASSALVAARDELSRLQTLEREDAGFLRDLERIGGDIRAATARRDHALHELENIDASEKRRAELAPVAASEPTHRASVEAHERERERHATLTSLNTAISRSQNGMNRAAADLEEKVAGSATSHVRDWTWRKADAKHSIETADRLIAVGEKLDVAGAQTRADSLEQCRKLVEDREKQSLECQKLGDFLQRLEAQRTALIAEGDPRTEATQAAKQRELALANAEKQRASELEKAKTRDELTPIIRSLKTNRFDGACPTCGRPFDEHSMAITLSALEDRVDQLESEIRDLKKLEKNAEQEAKACQKVQLNATERLEKVIDLDGRLDNGRAIVAENRTKLDNAIDECRKALAEHHLEHEPTCEEVRAAQEHADAFRTVHAALGVVRQLRSTLSQLAEEIASAERDITALGPVSYDESAHKSAEADLALAIDAIATIRQIDREIARRPKFEADRDRALTDIQRLEQEKKSVDDARESLGFDRAELDQAAETEQTALDGERSAIAARNEALLTQRDAEAERANLQADQERIIGLSLRAEERQREADELQRMYKEFTLFDQFVANRITPQMADHASTLVAEVTEGKYDRIEFDDDYGIMVYDGEERFPLEEFSGGERDVIALCARLALSRIVGGRARRPVSFLVLDEVFGSLDRDRRAHLLETLERLSGTAEAFRQLFIISHVDDVRQAPAINEIWRISETSEGVSNLENLTDTGGFEEL
jgi:DNA repair protein SbcC/Rad50